MQTSKRAWARKRGGASSGSVAPDLLAITDTFTRADQGLAGNLTETGDKRWITFTETLALGKVGILTNVVRSAAIDGYALIEHTAIEDVEVEIVIQGSGTYALGVILASHGRVHTYILRVTTANAMQIYRVLDTVVVLIANGVNAGSGSFTLKGEKIGTQLTLYENGVAKLTVADGNITDGACGFTLSGANSVVESVEINQL